ncbi:MAG: hypothetical protein WC616_00860 [Candidatus Omnitrophota bacterium]
MHRKSGIIFILFLVVILSGCVTRLVDFTMISTKNIDLARGADFKRGPSRATGEDLVAIIIFIPTGVPNIKTAIDRAIESVPGSIALLDGVLSVKGWYIPYIYGESSYVVEGTPLIDPKLVLAKLPSKYIFCRADRKGNVKEIRYLSKAEFELFRKKIGV